MLCQSICQCIHDLAPRIADLLQRAWIEELPTLPTLWTIDYKSATAIQPNVWSGSLAIWHMPWSFMAIQLETDWGTEISPLLLTASSEGRWATGAKARSH